MLVFIAVLVSRPLAAWGLSPVCALEGQVLDAQTGQPVLDAEAALLVGNGTALTAETNAQGHWCLSEAPAGRFTLGMAAPGYARANMMVTVGAPQRVRAFRLERQSRASTFETVVREVDRSSTVPVVVGSLTTLDHATLTARAPLSANEALRGTAGVHVVDEDATGLRQSVAFRGLDPRRSRRILVLEDGAPIGAAPYGDPDMYYTPAIERVDHIDIAKGSDVILHGPQTIGGVLNYVSGPVPQQPTAQGELRAATRGYSMARMMAGGSLGPAGGRLDLIHRRAAGPRGADVQVLDLSAKGEAHWGGLGTSTARLGLYDESGAGVYAGLTRPQFAAGPNVTLNPHDRYNLRRQAITLRPVLDVGGHLRMDTLVYGSLMQRRWRRQLFDRTGAAAPYERILPPEPGEPATLGGDTLFFSTRSEFRNRDLMVAGVEPRAGATFSTGPLRHEFVGGVRLHAEQLREDDQQTDAVEAPSGESFFREVNRGLALAVFGQYRLALWDSLRITPGLRVEAFGSQRQTLLTLEPNDQGNLVPTATNSQGTQQTVAVMPGMGVSYNVLRNVLLYAGIHRGYAPPRTREALTPGGQNLHLAPEQSWNMEAGVRAAWGKVLRAETAVFHIDFQNQIIASSLADDVGQTGRPLLNAGRTRQVGLEGTATLDVAPMLGLPGAMMFTGNFTAVDSRFTAGAFRGKRVPYAPAMVASMQWRMEHPTGLHLQASASCTSDQYSDNDNRVAQSADGLVGPLHAYALYDATVGYTLEPLAITTYASVKNATDVTYVASRFPQGINPAGFRQLVVGLRWAL